MNTLGAQLSYGGFSPCARASSYYCVGVVLATCMRRYAPAPLPSPRYYSLWTLRAAPASPSVRYCCFLDILPAGLVLPSPCYRTLDGCAGSPPAVVLRTGLHAGSLHSPDTVPLPAAFRSFFSIFSRTAACLHYWYLYTLLPLRLRVRFCLRLLSVLLYQFSAVLPPASAIRAALILSLYLYLLPTYIPGLGLC